ncbi:hypothetical protein HID58_079253 [Brassica napus]|uniref:Uncharacterized protein n=1 Tax=Brassica napus TaxID=3708 RepID=A0ABQ7Y1J0_BRANA|nr:hypothetical protein HID58_079253 [Brassica napus]
MGHYESVDSPTCWIERDEDPIGKKLDRALINAAWFRDFPQSVARFEAGGISDHARCVVHLTGNQNEARKPFRFFNYLTEHAEFLQVVKRVWETTQEIHHSRSALSRFQAKLKLLKFEMRLLNKTHYGNLPNKTKLAFEEMCHCQTVTVTPMLNEAERLGIKAGKLPVGGVSEDIGFGISMSYMPAFRENRSLMINKDKM